MKKRDEILIFTRELGQLQSELQRCNGLEIKQAILDDIYLLEKTLEFLLTDAVAVTQGNAVKERNS